MQRGGAPVSLFVVVAAALFARLIVAGGLHLTEDEAYYRLWSMAPAFGYYDHPPMIAWWIWLGRHVAGDTPLGVRLAPILASAAVSFLVYDMARQMGAARYVAARAAIWFNAMLLVAAGGFLAVPDAPASLFWVSSLCCALRGKARASVAWWAAAGVLAGLAVISKYSALFLGPGLLLWLASSREGRAQLRRTGPWIACALAGAIFSLNVLWNADHGWLTFSKQFGRVAASRFEPRYLGEFLATQALLLNPLIAVFAGAAVMIPPTPGRAGVNLSPIFATTAPFLAYLMIHSLHDRVQAHWPAPLYPGLAVCAAVGAERLGASRAWRGWAKAAPLVGFGLTLAVLFYIRLPVALTGKADLALPIRGWPAFARRLEALRRETGAGWTGVDAYGLVAQLKTEPALRGPVLQLTERDRWGALSQGPAPDFSRPGLIVDLPRRVSAQALSRCFQQVRPLGEVARGDPGEAGKTYAVFLVLGPRRDILRSGC